MPVNLGNLAQNHKPNPIIMAVKMTFMLPPFLYHYTRILEIVKG